MASKSFPLLKLPVLPIAEILRYMGHIDAFVFSRISKRTKRIVKAYFKPRGFKMDIIVADNVTLKYKKKNELRSDISITKPIRIQLDADQYIDITNSVGSWHSENDKYKCLLKTQSEDLLVGLKNMYAELTEVIATTVGDITVYLDKIKMDHKLLIDWLDNTVAGCSMISIVGSNCAFEKCMWTLENIKSIKDVTLFAQPKDYPNIMPFHIAADYLTIIHGRWVKPAHLQRMGGKYISISNANLADEEIIEILDNLRSGFNPNMGSIHLQLNRQLDLDAILPLLALIDEDGSRGKFRRNDGSLGNFSLEENEKRGRVYTTVRISKFD